MSLPTHAGPLWNCGVFPDHRHVTQEEAEACIQRYISPHEQDGFTAKPQSVMAARELSGPLPQVQPVNEYRAFSLEELAEIGRGLIEDLTSRSFQLADLFIEVQNRAGTRESDRGRALAEFAAEIGFSERYARQWAQVARMFPAEERAKYPQFEFGHFRELARRTALPGEGPDSPARLERVRELAEECADQGFGVNGTIRHIEEKLRPEKPSEAELAREVAGRFCYRCAMGHPVWAPRQAEASCEEWTHGCDFVPGDDGKPSKTTAHPEPCLAAALWEYRRRLEERG